MVFHDLYFSLFDELLTRLEPEAVGCYWSHYFVWALGYADDVVLLAPSTLALRMTLNTCCQFATMITTYHSIQVFNSPHLAHLHHRFFLFVGQSLKLADHDRACHLGHILPSDLSDTDDILRAQTDMCHRANCFLSTFYAANPAIKTLLFRTFCLSLHGSACWDCHLPVCGHWKSLSTIC